MSLTHEYLQKILRYDPYTGYFFWNKARKGIRVDSIAGCKDRDNYTVIMLDKVNYFAHRLAWFYMTGGWPVADVDHIDLNPDNNKWTNLREATRGQNMQNGRLKANNSSGYKGVSFHRQTGKFRAYIHENGKQKYLGLFLTAAEASEEYKKAAKETYGKFYREN